jgi:hypothetical protein
MWRRAGLQGQGASFDTVAALPAQDDEEGWASGPKVFVMLSSAPFARVSKHARRGNRTPLTFCATIAIYR